MIKNIIFPIEYNHYTGGMLHSVVSLAKNLSNDYAIFLLVYKEAEILKFELDNVDSIILHNKWCINIFSPIKTISTYFEVRKLMKKFRLKDTLVFTNDVGSEIIFSGFGFFPIPLRRIFISRGGGYTGKTGLILKRGFKNVYKFIAVSKHQKNILQNVGVEDSKITIINNGISINNENYLLNHKNRIKNLSVIGYISENKNQILAVKALSLLISEGYNFILNIYGIAYSQSDKIYEKRLLDIIKQFNLEENVFFKGFEKNISEMYANTDILISTSLSEGFGRTIVEGIALGIPCIGLKESGGLRDIIINNENGILIKNDESELAEMIIKIYDDMDFRSKLSLNAIHTYKQKFTEEKMIENYKNFLQKLLI
jgi:glycosyltransferase involved in cell wall biosynthesis